jgi:hypothetical protein
MLITHHPSPLYVTRERAKEIDVDTGSVRVRLDSYRHTSLEIHRMARFPSGQKEKDIGHRTSPTDRKRARSRMFPSNVDLALPVERPCHNLRLPVSPSISLPLGHSPARSGRLCPFFLPLLSLGRLTYGSVGI